MSVRRSMMMAALAALLTGCHMPGRPQPGDQVPRPDAVLDFDQLFGENCAGCHGTNGQNGAATNLANPQYQALVDDATLRDIITNGQRGTLMPAFGGSGGANLTEQQIDALVHGMRARWSRGDVFGLQTPPPHTATQPANPANGQSVYAAACARCHGPTAQKPGTAGSILDGSFLGLVSEQMIRTTIIAGRPDIGHPDWRGLIPGRPMTDAEVTDVAAWLISQTPANPGQPYPSTPSTQPTTERPGEAQPKAAIRTEP
jgi:cytochrome c oxidase cbb3-type subunit III